MNKTIAAYNKIAEKYNEINKKSIWHDEFEFFDKNVAGKKIIEIGCGAGRDAEYFIENNYDYTGIDASEGMLEIARQKHPQAKFLNMDFTDLHFPKHSFDGFIACASLLHVPKKDVPKILSSIKHIMKTNALGFITVKSKKLVNGKLMDEGYIQQKELGVERYFAFYDKEEFKNILENNGFKVIEYHERTEVDGTLWFCYFVRL